MANEHPDKVVRVTLNDKGLAVPDSDPVRVKKDTQKVKWGAEFPFSIEISGASSMRSGGNDQEFSHVVKSGTFDRPAGTRIKYSITANGQTNDPDLEIEP
ncbi:MAG TPA: hypothetical protein VNA69_20950 [Thermoanaerobaculia bacterium]|nr:hypothetical protein [Thermoanaerobaculia bacterium]